MEFTSLAVGGAHACGIRAADGQTQCWGEGYFGEPTPPAGVEFTSLAAGYVQTCGIRAADGLAQCW